MSAIGFEAFLGVAGQAAGVETWWHLPLVLTGFWAVGCAIRLMDDVVDTSSDFDGGVIKPAQQLGSAALPYALASLSIGVLLAPKLTATLFLSAYTVGMISDQRRLLPSGLRGYQESMIALAVGTFSTGIVMAWSLAFIVFLQALDDTVDRHTDAQTGARNWCNCFGTVEVLLLGILALATSLSLSLLLTLLALSVAAIIERITYLKSEKVIDI